jgi:hypothetical protein
MVGDGQFSGLGFGGFGLVYWQGQNLAAHSQEQEEGEFENCHTMQHVGCLREEVRV